MRTTHRPASGERRLARPLAAAALAATAAVLMTAAPCIAAGDAGGSAPGRAHVTIYPAPPGEPASSDYQVFVNGKPVFCYTSYRFDLTSKTTILGRPVSPLSFAYFDFEGSVEVTVRFLPGLKKAGVDTSSVVVRPLAWGIKPTVKDGAFSFRISKPCQLSIEPAGGLEHPLHIFANPPEKRVPNPKDPNVLYFGPGRHELGLTQLKSGETVYIAGGAVVSLKPVPEDKLGKPEMIYGRKVWSNPGMLIANWQKHVTVRGRGILDGREALAHHQRGPLIQFNGCEDVTVEGIIIRESAVWSLNLSNCKGAHVSDVKIIGHYVNNDGIVIGGTSDALVENCFCHNGDDALEVKVWIPQTRVVFRNCVVWSDVGGALGLCCECDADLSKVLYEDCTVIHATNTGIARGTIGIELEGTGKVRGFRFENITIEDVSGEQQVPIKVVNNWDSWHMGLPAQPGNPYVELHPPKRAKPRGSIRDVLFRNVRVLHSQLDKVVLMADGPDSPIEGVTFDNVVVDGKRLVPGDPRILKNQWVTGVVVR